MYAELHALSNFSFLRGASHPAELVAQAAALGYRALALTDECSLAGVVKAHVAAKEHGIQLIIGSELQLLEGIRLVLLAPDRAAYGDLSGLITRARRRSPKGEYRLGLDDLPQFGKRCLALWLDAENEDINHEKTISCGNKLRHVFSARLWLGVTRLLGSDDQARYLRGHALARELDIPLVACGDVRMHCRERQPLQDALTAIRANTSVAQLGTRLHANGERYLRPLALLARLYPAPLLAETLKISALCRFSLDELRYCYPREVVPDGVSAAVHLQQLVAAGAAQRWPDGIPASVQETLERELALIRELNYEHYFLTVHDIVQFARSRGILCQGRGSAANSVVCYCLFITEVSPTRVSLLFERFMSRERDEPPDIDVDFEHERREEVIQYLYRKYGRERAALAATVITYRVRSAVRDIGKALGLSPAFIAQLGKSLAWWDRLHDLEQRFAAGGLPGHALIARQFMALVRQILGFPRHLSQHVGGFVITESPISQLVPVENASMPERTLIQWDKEDIEALGLLKVDVLALGMLSAIRKCLDLVRGYEPALTSVQAIPEADAATYDMLCAGDSVGVFQVESRAQMSMLPRLRPRCYYDLVIQIAIVRPGPIQGNMVHPYLQRRADPTAVRYPSAALESVLKSTLGIPIFQEQVIKIAMVAAGFSGGQADQLRRAMASWGKNGNLLKFQRQLVDGMLARGYREDFALQLFEQIKGFGGYGFPESHSASFALLAYQSAWLKRHHPAAFYCALLNSQPMGFYSPSQLIQDARRHGIGVQPIDVRHSTWEHQLERDARGRHPQGLGLRMGLCLVRNLGEAAARRIAAARAQRALANLNDLADRAQLDQGELAALAAANALRGFSPHRHQAHWQVLGIEPARPLLPAAPASEPPAEAVLLPAPSPMADMLADYRSTGLTLNQHPLALLRDHPAFRGCKRQIELPHHGNRRFVRVAGLVTGRQRPGTASGVVFLTLEDDTGNINVVVWKAVQERYRQPLLAAKLLLVKGILEARDGVIHVIAGELSDHSAALAELELRSRDFH